MEGHFKSYNQDQMLLFPKSLKDFIPKGHLVYLINDVVEKFDLSPIIQKYSKNGCRAYAPVMLTKILFYAYCTGVYSSRRIAQRLEDSVFFMYLSAMQHPDFRTISDFWKNHLKELSKLFVQLLRMCQELGMIRFGHISLDGSKVKANASKHKAMSYGRMRKKKDELKREIEELLRMANEIDEEEDKEYGDNRGDKLPDELAFKEERLRKIEKAMRRLEEERVKKRLKCPINDKASVGNVCKECSKREQCSSFGDFLRVKMLEKLKSEEGAKVYKKRKGIVEPVYGQMKWARGFRQFSMHSLEKAKGGFSCFHTYFWLVCLFYILKGRKIL